MIIHGKTGILVEKDNINRFSLSLLQLAEDPAYRSRLGYSARRLCEKKFDVRKIVDETMMLYLHKL